MYGENKRHLEPAIRSKRRKRRTPAAFLLLLLFTTGGFLAGAKILPGASGAGEYENRCDLTASVSSNGEFPASGGNTSSSGKHREETPKEDWRLMLVNRWNPLPEDYKITLAQLENGESIDERCYPDLQAMMDDCRVAGLSPVICSSYRTQEVQEELFGNQLNKWITQGYSQADARVEAEKIVAVPGTSEHQLGLALDIVDLSNQILDENQENTEVQKWLMEHSWEYGFILRYPNDKSHITGIVYEPWHYRYVGKEAAREIREQGICLEEYQ